MTAVSFTAANVENASYGLSLCAERAALAAAIAGGIGPGRWRRSPLTASPCGACRQWMLEFCVERVVFPAAAGALAVRRPDELLPRRVRSTGDEERIRGGRRPAERRQVDARERPVRGKVAIVSNKPQTTRHRVHGVVNGDGYQLVLVDLPGFQRPRDALTERMQRRVDQSLGDVDAMLFVLAADEQIGPGDRFIAKRVLGGAVPVVIALNKVDRRTPGQIAEQITVAAALGEFHALHPVSAVTGDGVLELRDELAALLPEGPQYFPTESLTDTPLELRISELVREKALSLTREEVPHAIMVEVEEIDRQARLGDDSRRDAVAEADRRGQGRQHDQGDRDPRATRDRAAARVVPSTLISA